MDIDKVEQLSSFPNYLEYVRIEILRPYSVIFVIFSIFLIWLEYVNLYTFILGYTLYFWMNYSFDKRIFKALHGRKKDVKEEKDND